MRKSERKKEREIALARKKEIEAKRETIEKEKRRYCFCLYYPKDPEDEK